MPARAARALLQAADFSLCPHVEEGPGTLWGLCQEGTDPTQEGSAVRTQSSSKGPPSITITFAIRILA